MSDTDRSRLDALIDLLADEVTKRIQARARIEPSEPAPAQVVPPIPADAPGPQVEPIQEPTPEPVEEPVPMVSSHAAVLMARLVIGVLIAVILINIPINAQGIALARSIPSSAALVIANGLLVREDNSPDVWVYRDGTFHWITSLEAFQHFDYRWENVHTVEPGFLNDFEKGKPVYVLVKCSDSPHIYRLENGRKRWIVDIPTFEAEGYVWSDVRFEPCRYLRSLPDGDSIPPGRGSPPPPLP
ncbi:hypothetical protein ANRL1_01934 [Anaerolineae bacterium]|nr:hypothetical protein ANRL1_01934 [Anaerolineae bacterium]